MDPFSPLDGAVGNLAGIFIRIDASDVFEQFTCSEIEALALVFRTAGRDDAADAVIFRHAKGDSQPEDQHHHVWLEHKTHD
jgi:hypothetical protein